MGTKISSSSITATAPFNFASKASGQMTGFNMGAPISQVPSLKPAVTSSQAASTQQTNQGMFGKGANGFSGQPAQSGTNPPQTVSSSAGGFGVSTLNTGARQKGQSLRTSTLLVHLFLQSPNNCCGLVVRAFAF